jgi:competence protein ComEA
VDPLPGRPLPPRPLAQVVRAWLQWFGLIRLVVIAIAVGAVGAGAYWLLRAPVAPIENTLPMASRTSTTAVLESATTSAPGAMSTSTTAVATGAPSGAVGVVVVDVAGAVVVPGVYELAAGSRAHDAIEIAGGLAPDAEVDALNLAAPLRDGDRLYVPHRGVPVPTVIQPTGGSSATVGSSTPVAGPIDLNRATVAELDVLPGIGPATAAAIVAYREQVGPFAAIDDLLKVQGIGPAKLDAIRDLVVV